MTLRSTRALYDACKHISSQGRRYVYGGGHGVPLSSIQPSDGLDCSSSCSLALIRSGFFRGRTAWVSGDFRTWGEPGRGKHFTVWYNGRHVWIEFYGQGQYRRFDTSPWGWGSRGPRVRKNRRPHLGFKARHWPGC